jgi:hypothetical protein
LKRSACFTVWRDGVAPEPDQARHGRRREATGSANTLSRQPRFRRWIFPETRASGMSSSRKLRFRCREISETQFVALAMLGNPICRASPIRSGLRICTNAQITFRCMEFSETRMQDAAHPYALGSGKSRGSESRGEVPLSRLLCVRSQKIYSKAPTPASATS